MLHIYSTIVIHPQLYNLYWNWTNVRNIADFLLDNQMI